MTFLGLAARNVLRNKFRTTLTIFGVAIATLSFVLIRTVLDCYTIGATQAAQDRVVSRHKVTFVMTLPKRYVDDVRQVPGVKTATWANWFGGKDARHENEFFQTLAVDGKTFFDVYNDMHVTPEEYQRWMDDRQGAIVGDQIAKLFGWKIGDTITLAGTIFPGDWPMHVTAIYTPTTKIVDRRSLLFHWEYLNDDPRLKPRQKDQIGWVTSRVSDPSHAADVGVAIDKVFDERDIQTISQDERSFATSFLGMFSAVLTALDVVSVVILGIMMLILGNTIAMGVRERTSEYGVLRAIGFLPGHVASLVLGEGIVLGILGGGLGLAISLLFVNKGLGRVIEENLGNIFPIFYVSGRVVAMAMGLAVVTAAIASLAPAYRAFRINVLNSLRRIG